MDGAGDSNVDFPQSFIEMLHSFMGIEQIIHGKRHFVVGFIQANEGKLHSIIGMKQLNHGMMQMNHGKRHFVVGFVQTNIGILHSNIGWKQMDEGARHLVESLIHLDEGIGSDILRGVFCKLYSSGLFIKTGKRTAMQSGIEFYWIIIR